MLSIVETELQIINKILKNIRLWKIWKKSEGLDPETLLSQTWAFTIPVGVIKTKM